MPTKGLLDKGVICKTNALLVDLAKSTLVGELTHRFKVGVAVRQMDTVR